jgi:glycerophosphoryl diester phosphodiesterase
VVHHDDALGRLTEGSGRLAAITAEELRGVAFRVTRERMMSLGELCDLVAGHATLLVELKSRRDGDHRLPARVSDVLKSYAGPIAAMSFDPQQIAALRELAPNLVCGLVSETLDSVADVRAGWRARPQFIAYSVKRLPAPVPLLGRYLLRMPLLTWTVRTAEDRAKSRRWADQMIFEGFRP